MQSKEDKKKNQRVETQQLSPKDIQRSEAPYKKEFNDFIMGLAQGEKYKKNTIKKLARLLEEAGTIDLHEISTRIKNDLREAAEKKGSDEPLIDPKYVSMVLEDKYKKRQKNKGSDTDTEAGQNKGNISFISSSTTGSTAAQSQPQPIPGPLQSTEEPKSVPQSLQEARDFDDWVNNLYDLTRRLAEQITGYHEDKILKVDDNFKLISETRQYRFDAAKRLADLDLRTVHKEVRRDILLLNDFIEHLEKELDSRKRNEQLRSE